MQCTVRFSFSVNGTQIVGGYSPDQGHSSSLKIGGENVLADGGDGNLSAPVCRFLSGSEIETGTLNSRFVGRILSVSSVESECWNVFPPKRLKVLAIGEFDGSQGSITGGISCHCGWQIVAVSSVSGRFGTFEIRGGDPLARYNAAKNAHRARFGKWVEVEEHFPENPAFKWTETVVEWTPLAKRIATELGHTLEKRFVSSPGAERYDACSPAYWADNCEAWLEEKQRLTRLARVKRLTRNIPANVRDVRFREGKGRLTWEYVTA